MKKRLGACFIAGLLVMATLIGCGSKPDHTEDIKAAADGFLGVLESGEFGKLSEYASKELLETGDLKDISKLQNIQQDILSELDLAEDALTEEGKQSLNGFVDTLSKELVKSYEIGDISESDGTAEVKATLTYGFDPGKIEDIDIDDKIDAIADQYLADNKDKLVEMFMKEGEDAAQKAIMNDLMGDILKEYSDALIATGERSENVSLKMENKDGKWVVTEAFSVE